MTTTFYRYAAEGLALADAVAALAEALRLQLTAQSGAASASASTGPALTALLYSPAACRFAVYSGGAWHQHDGPANVQGVYEARVFSPLAELRWLNDPSPQQRHRAVVVCEQALSGALAAAPWNRTDELVCGTIDQGYLLWGSGSSATTAAGWSELATARIGALKIPLAGIQRGQRVRLKTVEYLTQREHGNVVVLDERLVALEPLPNGEA
jgi:CRISPR-associated protein (TIGR03984 family)